jgi:cytochrome b
MQKPARTDAGAATSPDAHPTVRVWDLGVRAFHWLLVLSFVVAWFTSHSSETIHHLAGYVAAALVALRVVWGVVGTHYARFAQFARGPRTVTGYLRAIVTGREARYIGHNPAGGVMALTLMGAMAATAGTGWMMTTDQFWGVEWVTKVHDWVAHGLLLLVLVHLGGVALASFRHRENLVGSMLTGRKRQPKPGDVV